MRVAVENLCGVDLEVIARDHQAAIVVRHAGEVGGQVLARLDLATCAAERRGADIDIGAAAQLPGGVVDAAGAGDEVALAMHHAPTIVQAATVQGQRVAAQDAAGDSGIGIDQRLAVGVHAHSLRRLQ